MIGNFIGFLVMVVGVVFFAWVARRAWRAKAALLKWSGTILGGLLALVFLLVSLVTLKGLIQGNRRYQAPVPVIAVAGTPEQIERGRHIADTFCASCHSQTLDLPLTGGLDLGKGLPMNLGTFVAGNLTPAGPLQDWSDGEIFRALRDGIDKDGRKLFFMSIVRGRYMSDEHLQAVIAYLRSQPAVVNKTQDPPDQANLLGVIMFGAGLLPEGKPPIEGAITAPPKGPTVEYGEYLLSYNDCRDCHGEDLKGGVEGQLAPIGWNLELVKNWTLEQFITTLRTGVDPTGYSLSAAMPWKNVGRMDDIELEAIYNYLVNME